MKSPIAMISYSSHDHVAAELLHDEFALRGFSVAHDRYTFTDGSRIPASMTSAVDNCDVFVSYLTRNSLYLDSPADQPRPALASELLPALRRRRSNLRPGKVDRPIIIPLVHGLGDRDKAAETIRRKTGENLSSLWSTWLDQDTEYLTQFEAATAADNALYSLLKRDRPPNTATLAVATRGTTPSPRRFTIDGTRLLGGYRRPGSQTDWIRFFAAARSVIETLTPTAANGQIQVELACHLSAALAIGRLLHQATRWSPAITTRHGEVTPASSDQSCTLLGDFDQHAETGDLIVDIDLLGHDVAALTDTLAAQLPPAGGRISLSRTKQDDLSPGEISCLARCAAAIIRDGHSKAHPRRIHLTIAAPAAYATLLGHHLTALRADLMTYELDDTSYTEALTIPYTTA